MALFGDFFHRQNRRAYPRCPTHVRAMAVEGHQKRPGSVTDFSEGGCRFVPDNRGFDPERAMRLLIGQETYDARIVRRSDKGLHLCWLLPHQPNWPRHCDACDQLPNCYIGRLLTMARVDGQASIEA